MLSQKSRYAIRALQHLADIHPLGRAKVQDISKNQNIPPKFLALIMVELAKNGLVVGLRGPRGGYQLARDPSQISYGEVVRLMRGVLALVPCANRDHPEPCIPCLLPTECHLHAVMVEIFDRTAEKFDSITFAK